MEWKKLSELQDDKYVVVQDTMEINQVLEAIGADLYYPTLLVSVRNGEYEEVWGCDSFIPWLDLRADRLR